MCVISTPEPPKVEMPAERQAARAPDGGSITDSASRRATDRQRAGASTVLTSQSGVSSNAQTGQKTLLGA